MDDILQDYASLKAQGDVALSDENYELAEQCFQKALALESENPEAYNNLGRLYDFQLQDEKAKQFYLKAFELNPCYFAAVSNLGIFYLERAQYELCIEWLQKAVELNPKNTKTLTSTFRYLGLAYGYLEEYEKSEDYYRKGLEIDPEDIYLQLGLARMLGYRYEDDAASEILIKLVSKAPNDLLSEIYYCLGLTHQSKKDFEAAIEYFNKSITLTDDPSEAYRRLAEIYESYETCDTDKKAIQLLKNNIENGTVTYVDYYNIGRLYSFIEDFELSIEYFNCSIALQENKKSYYQRARVLFIIEDYLKSIESVKEAILIDSNNPKYYALLGFSYFKLDSFEEALENFKKALDLEGFALEDCKNTYDMIASVIQEKGSHEDLIPLFRAASERINNKFNTLRSKLDI